MVQRQQRLPLGDLGKDIGGAYDFFLQRQHIIGSICIDQPQDTVRQGSLGTDIVVTLLVSIHICFISEVPCTEGGTGARLPNLAGR